MSRRNVRRTLPGRAPPGRFRRRALRDTVVGKYNVPALCASSCHGSIQPKIVTRVPQMNTASGPDRINTLAPIRFFQSCVVRIGKILKLELPPNQAPRCLACHALAFHKSKRSNVRHNDGVTCEKLPRAARLARSAHG